MKRSPLCSRGGRKAPRLNDCPTKRAWIRQFPCDVARQPEHRCAGVTQCCHEKHGWNQDDDFCLPGCAQFHTKDHSGRSKLEKKFGFDFRERCEAYHNAWKDQRWATWPAA